MNDELESLLDSRTAVQNPNSVKASSPNLFSFIKLGIFLLSITSLIFLVTLKSKNGSENIRTINTNQLVSLAEILGKIDESTSGTVTVSDVSITVSSPGYSTLKSLELLPWTAIAEPHRPQYITLKSIKVDGQTVDLDNELISVSWLIDGKRYEGYNALFTVTSTGVKICTVTVTALPSETSSEDTSYSVSHDFDLAVKYVRRELRALTDSDRTEFFDALYTMYTVNETYGVETYGNKFKTAEYYLFKHLNGAGTSDCDHWHDGAGIVTHHTAFTLEVEQTLQAINPAVSMPYWEYGMDSILYPNNFADSPIFKDDWFGQSNPLNDEHRVDAGRWSEIKMPSGDKYSTWSISETGKLNPFVNPYGIMRSPWNKNPSQYITRHNATYTMTQYPTMPSCSVLRSCFFSKSVERMNDCFNGATHGPVHIKIGGAWGEGSAFDSGTLGFLRNPDKLLLFKVLWRMGYTRCPSDCTGKSLEECVCAVPQEYIDRIGAKGILLATNVFYILNKFISSKATDDFYLSILRAIEDPGVAGEMFTSAASFDPTFWPLHGAAERLLDYKRLLVQKKMITDFDESWGYPAFDRTSGAAYVPGICDWSNVKGVNDLTLPNCTLDVVCPGHNELDLLEFSDFLNKGETYTNGDMYAFIHPANDDLPYVYDTFDYDYCAEVGFDFLDQAAAAAAEEETNEGEQPVGDAPVPPPLDVNNNMANPGQNNGIKGA